MTIEIPKEARKLAVASIERYFQENREEKFGNIAEEFDYWRKVGKAQGR